MNNDNTLIGNSNQTDSTVDSSIDSNNNSNTNTDGQPTIESQLEAALELVKETVAENQKLVKAIESLKKDNAKLAISQSLQRPKNSAEEILNKLFT